MQAAAGSLCVFGPKQALCCPLLYTPVDQCVWDLKIVDEVVKFSKIEVNSCQ